VAAALVLRRISAKLDEAEQAQAGQAKGDRRALRGRDRLTKREERKDMSNITSKDWWAAAAVRALKTAAQVAVAAIEGRFDLHRTAGTD
jgi:hypothetical protein